MRAFHRFFGMAILLFVLFYTSCSPASPQRETQFAMGTVCSITIFDSKRPDLFKKAFERIYELENIFSANLEGSDLNKVNKNAGLVPVRVSPELIEVLLKALEYAEKSGGLFDPTVGPLVKLWAIGTDEAHIPTNEEIISALALIDYRDIEINQKEGTVYLKRPGMALDLGGIAKGYAADEAAELLAMEGVERAIIDLGGNIFALGERKVKKAEDSCWRIGIQDPGEERGMYIGIVKVKNKSVVTSGNYERFFEEDGLRYHHIFSTETGFPAGNSLLSVSVAADRSIDADALSTSAFVLGWERGRELIASVNGAEGIFVFDDHTVRVTGSLEKNFILTAEGFR